MSRNTNLLQTETPEARIGVTWGFRIINPAGDTRFYQLVRNLWPLAGLNDALNLLRATSVTAVNEVGLISGAGFTALGETDTLASHAGWSELTGYSGGRKTPTFGTIANRTVATSAMSFAITSNAQLRGAMLVGGNGSANVLRSIVALEANQAVDSGDTVLLTLTVSIQAPGAGDDNMLTTAGANMLLDRLFKASGSVPALYVGLMNNDPVLQANDAHGSHGAWTEFTGYTGDRKAITHSAASSAMLAQSGSATFACTADGRIGGFFVTTNETKGNEGSGTIVLTRRLGTNRRVSAGRTATIAGAHVTLGNIVAAPIAPPIGAPVIASFTISDSTPDEDVAITFSGTITGTLTGWSLDPGDGSPAYTGSGSSISQAHTYATPGTYTATLTANGPGGAATPATIPGIVVSAVGGTTFQRLAYVEVPSGGSSHITLVGIPVVNGALSNARKNKIVGRTAAGTTFALQADNHHTKINGNVHLLFVSGQVPADHVAGAEIEVGYSDTIAQPANPNWDAVTSNHTTTFTAEFSFYELKKLYFHLLGQPYIGDIIEVTLDNGVDGPKTYTLDLQNRAFGFNQDTTRSVLTWALHRMISADPTGHFETLKESVVTVSEFPASGDPSRQWAMGGDVGLPQEGIIRTSQNSNQTFAIGRNFARNFQASFCPEGFYSMPSLNADGGLADLAGNFHIWQRYRAGAPLDITGTFNIQQLGRSLQFTGTLPACGGGWTLNYVSQTANFSTEFFIKGRTSGATALVKAQQDSGASGKLCIWWKDGDFINGEIIDGVRNQVASATYGSATVSGTATRNKITSGAKSADYLGGFGQTLCFRNATGGAFVNGDVLTDDFGNTCTMNGSTIKQGNARLPNSSTDTAGRTSGSLPVSEASSPRVTWTASYNDPARSPLGAGMHKWIEGHKQLQPIYKVPLRDPSNNIHPHIYLFMGPTFAADGSIVGRWVRMVNDKMRAASRDYTYDVVSISDGVTNFIASDIQHYRQKIHTMFVHWTWQQGIDVDVPKARTQDFQRAGLIWNWPLDTGFDYRPALKVVTQGMDSSGDNYLTENAARLAGHGGYAKPKPGLPLFWSNIKMDGSGGGSPTIGVYSGFEAMFWKGNRTQLWPHLNGMAVNGFGAGPYYLRDESVTGDWADATPHPYLQWFLHSGSAFNAPTPDKITTDSKGISDYFAGPKTKPFSLWNGYYDGGGYGAGRTFADSHVPPHPGFSRYLIRGDWFCMDDVENFGRQHISQSGNGFSNKNPPKTGGVAGDNDHVIAAAFGNGNRSFAWPWRAAMFCAAIMPDKNPRKAIWRRTALDGLGHMHEVSSKTWYGFLHGTKNLYSDVRTTGSMRGGEGFRGYNSAAGQGEVMTIGAGEISPYMDIFKGSYADLVMVTGNRLGVFDAIATMQLKTGWAAFFDETTAWWKLASCGGIMPFPCSGFNGPLLYPQSVTCFPENFATYQADLESKYTQPQLISSGNWGHPFDAGPPPSLSATGVTYPTMHLFVPFYPRYRFYQVLVEMMADDLPAGTLKNRFAAIEAQTRAALPHETVDTANHGGCGNDKTYGQIWGAWATVRNAEIPV